MNRFTVYVTAPAWDEVKELPGHIRQRVRRAIAGLADEPRPPSSKLLSEPLAGRELRRIRLDAWRVVYAITESEGTLDILAIRKRPPYDYGDLIRLLDRH